MFNARIYKLRRALSAARAHLDEIERLLNEAEGVARVTKAATKPVKKKAKKAKAVATKRRRKVARKPVRKAAKKSARGRGR